MIFKSVLKNVINNLKVKKMYKMNYSDQIVRSIVLTTYMKKKFNILFMMFLTIVLRSFLASLFCIIFSYNLYIDFFLHSLITVIIVLYSHIIYDLIKTKETYFYQITRYTINNYTIENYRRWKRNITLTISGLLIIYLLLFEVNSYLLIYYIIQNVFTYGIIDVIEHKKLNKFLKTLKDKPKHKKFQELTILEDYYDNEQLLKDNNLNDSNEFDKKSEPKKTKTPINEFLVVNKKI